MKATDIVLLSVKNSIERMDKNILEHFNSKKCSEETAIFILREVFSKARRDFLQNLKAERVQNKIAPQVEQFYNDGGHID